MITKEQYEEYPDIIKVRLENEEVWLTEVEKSIVNACCKVRTERLRKYLRNWTTELNRKRKPGEFGVRPPRK
jgi:hypothetical protein